MENADLDEAAPERPIRRIRRERLALLLAQYHGPAGLSSKTGVVDTHLIACSKGRRDVGDALANKIEKGAEKPFGWMDSDPSFDDGDHLAPSITGELLAELSEILMSRNELVRFTASTLLFRLSQNPGEVVDIVGSLRAVVSAADARANPQPPDNQGRPCLTGNTTNHPQESATGESKPMSLERAAKGARKRGAP